RLAPLDPAVAVAGDADWGVSRGVAGERSAPRREMRCRWKRGRVVGVRRAPGVRRDVVAAPGGVAVDVDAAGRAMARPRRTRQEQKDGGKGCCPVEPSHMPSGLRGWLQSLPDAEPAIYGDTKARVKEKGRGCLLTASG